LNYHYSDHYLSISSMSYQFSSPVTVEAHEWDIKNVSFATLRTMKNPTLKMGRIQNMHLKTPFMYCPFGATHVYQNVGESQTHQGWTIHMNLMEGSFQKKTEEFDQWMLNEATNPTNWVQWLGTKTKTFAREMVETKYCRMTKYPHRNGERLSQFPPFIRVSLPVTYEEPYQLSCDVYNKNKKLAPIAVNKITDTIPRECWCSATLMGTLWCSRVGFGIVWYVKQLIVYPTKESIPSNWKAEETFKIEKDDDDDDDIVKDIKLVKIDKDGVDDIETVKDKKRVSFEKQHETEKIEEDDDEITYVQTRTQNDPFKLKCNGPNTLFIAPNKYSIGEETTVSRTDLYSRFFRELNGCFEGFDWDHTCIAGGLLTGLIDKKYDPTVYRDSDIDLFIYGATPEETKQHFSRVFKFFQEKFAELWVVPLKYDNVMVINLGQSHRVIQMIGVTDTINPSQLIGRFDLSHCQIAFDGNEFLCTSEFNETMRSRQSQILRQGTSAYRLYKAYLRGFSVMIPKHPVYVKSDQMCTYGVNETHSINNLKEFTLDKLLTDTNIASFSKMSFASQSKEQYVKDGVVIQGAKLTEWFADYLQTHTPCRFK